MVTSLLVVRRTAQIDPGTVGRNVPVCIVQLLAPTLQKVSILSCTYVQLEVLACVVTVRVATLLVTEPAELLTTTVNCAPSSALVVGGVV